MKEKAESKEKIKGGIDKRKNDMDDKGKHMAQTVHDKKVIAETSKRLKLSGTKEGAKALKEKVQQSAEDTHKVFEKQNGDLEKKFTECTQAEKDLQQRTDDSKDDARDSKRASQQIKEAQGAKNFLNKAEEVAKGDANHTTNERKRQESDRKTSENRRDQQKNQLNGNKLAW